MTPTNEQILAAVNECKGTAATCLLVLLVLLVGVALVVAFQLMIGVVQIKQANYTAALLSAAKNVGRVNEQRRDDAKQALSRIEDKVEQGSAEAKAAAAEVARAAAEEAARVAVAAAGLPTGTGTSPRYGET